MYKVSSLRLDGVKLDSKKLNQTNNSIESGLAMDAGEFYRTLAMFGRMDDES